MTKEQLIHFLATRKATKLTQNAVWSDLTAVVATLSNEEKDAISKSIANGSYSGLDAVRRAMVDNFRTAAELEANTALADDSLTLGELDSLL